VPEGHLARVAREQVQADRPDRGDARVVQDAEPEVADQEERQQQVEQDEQHQADLRPAGAEELEVVGVVPRHPVVRAHQTLRTSFVPNSP
jgi:hypothetical protein